MHPSLIPNLCLRLVKWPVALLSICMLPFGFQSIWLSTVLKLPFTQVQWFVGGLIGYWIAWLFFFRKRIFGSYLSTFEHEFTHAIFAWVTLHRVTGLSVTWRHGGACTYEGSGGGNWLIASAPYWFPTVALPCVILANLLEMLHAPEAQLGIGVAVGYQLTSTWRETHFNQTDLQQTGWVFAALFLPTANLLTYAYITLWTLGSAHEANWYLREVWRQTHTWLYTAF